MTDLLSVVNLDHKDEVFPRRQLVMLMISFCLLKNCFLAMDLSQMEQLLILSPQQMVFIECFLSGENKFERSDYFRQL